MQKISSWGRLSADLHEVVTLDSYRIPLLSSSASGIAYGMGRSYGDVCLNPRGILWNTERLDRFIHFNEITGQLTCQSGVLLRDIQQLFTPRGWILPVTPGTQFVTVGGAIANDVHGKNHHQFGAFGNHVQHIKLMRTDGEMIGCTPKSDWFSATVGGLGLTGIILEATIQLRRISNPWLIAETIPYTHLNNFFHLAEHSEISWENTVSWFDCTSDMRGLFMRANFSAYLPEPPIPNKIKTTLFVPFTPLISPIHRFLLKPFNALYFYLKSGKKTLEYYDTFFYPLDTVRHWNRLYGPKGFYQYQSLVPLDTGKEVTKAMLKEIAQFGQGSFLSVLKTFGNIESKGMLSFPKQGVTLALDFPNKGEKTLKLFERLDCIVSEAGGRLYPAKDARMPRSLFESGYPQLNTFLKYRDPGISSAFSRRLMGD